MRTIPLVDLHRQYDSLRGEIDAAIAGVIASAGFIGGPEVTKFEAEFAAFCDAGGAVGVANGTDAIEIVLRAMGVGAGDEVITVANTFIATIEGIMRVGATPVFVDVRPDTMLMDAALVEAAMTPRTRVIMPVHLYGQCCDMDAIGAIAQRAGLRVVEDAAQAHGAEWNGRRAGTMGDAATFSFYPGKNLGAYGDAGAVVVNDPALRERIRMFANHGRKEKYTHELIGQNSRLDPLQAAILRVKLRALPAWNEARARLAASYLEALAGSGLTLPVTAPGATPVWHLFVIRSPEREAIRVRCKAAGVETGVHYPLPLHQQPALAGVAAPSLPVTERSAREVLSIPLFPELTDAELRRVVAALR